MKEELIGFKEIDPRTIRCPDCGSKLAEVIVIETNEHRESRGLKPLRSKFKINKCFNCGGSTFESQIFEGTVIAGPLKDDVEIETEDTEVLEDGTLFFILSTRRSK